MPYRRPQAFIPPPPEPSFWDQIQAALPSVLLSGLGTMIAGPAGTAIGGLFGQGVQAAMGDDVLGMRGEAAGRMLGRTKPISGWDRHQGGGPVF